jgi:hypothetical protein
MKNIDRSKIRIQKYWHPMKIYNKIIPKPNNISRNEDRINKISLKNSTNMNNLN